MWARTCVLCVALLGAFGCPVFAARMTLHEAVWRLDKHEVQGHCPMKALFRWRSGWLPKWRFRRERVAQRRLPKLAGCEVKRICRQLDRSSKVPQGNGFRLAQSPHWPDAFRACGPRVPHCKSRCCGSAMLVAGGASVCRVCFVGSAPSARRCANSMG